MAESSVKVLRVVDVFMLSLYRKDLDDFYWNRPPGVVWFGSLRDYPNNICILLARSPCGRHRLRSPGLSIASFRSQKWLALYIHSVVGPCHPYIPLPLFLLVVGLPLSGLVEMVACKFL